MKITETVKIIKKDDGRWVVNGEFVPYEDKLAKFYAEARALTEGERETLYNEYAMKGILPSCLSSGTTTEEVSAPVEDTRTTEEIVKGALTNLIKFFTEFEMTPSFRFINTLSHCLAKSEKVAKNYIVSYFDLADNSYALDVKEKMKSAEFKQILKDLKLANPTTNINNRFKVYYGAPGTGKTTLAMTETDNRCVICNNSMTPADLMEDFDFDEGKPSFKKSLLWECMEKGEPLVLDEMNLLPFESLRFLQGLLDGKKEFQYKGTTVSITDGFQIICTMNLSVGGMRFGLPEPLVDRAYEMKEFTINADALYSALA